MNANVERIDNNSIEITEQLPQTDAALIALLFNRIEAYQQQLKEEEDKLNHFRDMLDEARRDVMAFRCGRTRTLRIISEPAKYKSDLQDKLDRIQCFWEDLDK